MRKYLEIIEKTVGEVEAGTRDFIRIPLSDDNISQTLEDILILLNSSKEYNVYIHECFHDESLKKPCRLTFLMKIGGEE